MLDENVSFYLPRSFPFLTRMISVHVLHIASTNIYDQATTAGGALAIMESRYSATSWHYTSNGHQPDLHHGIIHKNLGGGKKLFEFRISAFLPNVKVLTCHSLRCC